MTHEMNILAEKLPGFKNKNDLDQISTNLQGPINETQGGNG